MCHITWQEDRLQLNSITGSHTGGHSTTAAPGPHDGEDRQGVCQVPITFFWSCSQSLCRNEQKINVSRFVRSGCVATSCVCVLDIFKWASTIYSNPFLSCDECRLVKALLVRCTNLTPFTCVLSASVQFELADLGLWHPPKQGFSFILKDDSTGRQEVF